MLPPRAERRRLYRWWVRDPLVGARLLALHHGMRALPTEAVSALGGRLGRLAGWRLYAAADVRARVALRALRPDLALEEDRVVGEMWEGVGRCYAEFSAEDRLWPEGRVAVEGEEHLVTAGGRPLIVAGLHLGNWELLPITLGYLGHRLTDVYQPQRNRFEDGIARRVRERTIRLIVAARPEAGVRLLPPSANAGALLLAALRDGEALMMFVDEHAGGRVQAPAFGRPVGMEGNLARVVRLARLSGASVVPAYARRLEGARFVVRFLPAVAMRDTGDRAGDLVANVAALDGVVAGVVLEHLPQWFMLHEFRGDW